MFLLSPSILLIPKTAPTFPLAEPECGHVRFYLKTDKTEFKKQLTVYISFLNELSGLLGKLPEFFKACHHIKNKIKAGCMHSEGGDNLAIDPFVRFS